MILSQQQLDGPFAPVPTNSYVAPHIEKILNFWGRNFTITLTADNGQFVMAYKRARNCPCCDQPIPFP